MKYFPFFFNLNKKNVLLIGGGDVAERKVDLLVKVNANITIVSPDFTDYIKDLWSWDEGLLPETNQLGIEIASSN